MSTNLASNKKSYDGAHDYKQELKSGYRRSEWFETNTCHNMKENIFLKNGTLFATGYNRIVHGERGDYVEFEKEHIVQKLLPKFNNFLNDDLDIYYWWLYPESDKETKVYLQKKTVKYADYKIGKYYISPYLLKDFKDPEQLFPYV